VAVAAAIALETLQETVETEAEGRGDGRGLSGVVVGIAAAGAGEVSLPVILAPSAPNVTAACETVVNEVDRELRVAAGAPGGADVGGGPPGGMTKPVAAGAWGREVAGDTGAAVALAIGDEQTATLLRIGGGGMEEVDAEGSCADGTATGGPLEPSDNEVWPLWQARALGGVSRTAGGVGGGEISRPGVRVGGTAAGRHVLRDAEVGDIGVVAAVLVSMPACEGMSGAVATRAGADGAGGARGAGRTDRAGSKAGAADKDDVSGGGVGEGTALVEAREGC